MREVSETVLLARQSSGTGRAAGARHGAWPRCDMPKWSLGPAPVSHFSDAGNVPGIIEYYRRMATGGARPLLVILPDVTVVAPPGLGLGASSVQMPDGRVYAAEADGHVTLRADDAAPLLRAGWQIDKIKWGYSTWEAPLWA